MKGKTNSICSVKPIHYDLSLYELELGGNFTFQGTVKIQVEIKEPTREITLNAIAIKVHEAYVSLSEYGPSGRKFWQILHCYQNHNFEFYL